ncbi:MAG: hypothetical protein ACI4EV_02585 [Lachnospiraceae bacterium]
MSGTVEVGYQDYGQGVNDYVGYAEVDASDNVYAQMNGKARYAIAGVNYYQSFNGSFDDDTYRQITIKCLNVINRIECTFKVVSDDGTYLRVLTREGTISTDYAP